MVRFPKSPRIHSPAKAQKEKDVAAKITATREKLSHINVVEIDHTKSREDVKYVHEDGTVIEDPSNDN